MGKVGLESMSAAAIGLESLCIPCLHRNEIGSPGTLQVSWPRLNTNYMSGALETSTLDEVHFLPFFTRMKNNIFTLCQEYIKEKEKRVNPHNSIQYTRVMFAERQFKEFKVYELSKRLAKSIA